MSVFTRLFTPSERPHDMIAANPRLEGLHSGRGFSLIGTVFILMLFLILIIFVIGSAIITSGTILFPWYFLFLMLIFLSNTGFFSVQIHYWQRIENWRFAAVQGNERLLMSEQPQPDPHAVRMPVTIRISTGIERRTIASYLLWCTFLLMADVFFSIKLMFPSFPWFWCLLIAVLIDALFIPLFLLTSRKRRSIEVSDEGIKFQTLYKASAFIPWEEARLFACYSEPGPWKNSPITVYELSSARNVVHWTWTRRQSLLDDIWGTSLPFEEHNAQMRALCSLVAAKTGLPLYDLDKGQGSKE